MLQISPIELEGAAGAPPTDFSRFLSPRFYWGLFKRRFLHFVIPVVIILPLGAFVVMSLPALYLSEAKILVELQRIPTDLVKPTVTSMAAERIQVLEQRLLTRDNAMSLIEKFKLFPDRRGLFFCYRAGGAYASKDAHPTHRTGREPQFQRPRKHGIHGGIPSTEDPELAAKVAGELMTLILNEDLRTRTGRATETTRFLGREVTRLQSELAAVEAKLTDVQRAEAEAHADAERRTQEQRQAELEKKQQELNKLKAERLAKANQLSFNHPDVQAIQRRIIALERTFAVPPALSSRAPKMLTL